MKNVYTKVDSWEQGKTLVEAAINNPKYNLSWNWAYIERDSYTENRYFFINHNQEFHCCLRTNNGSLIPFEEMLSILTVQKTEQKIETGDIVVLVNGSIRICFGDNIVGADGYNLLKNYHKYENKYHDSCIQKHYKLIESEFKEPLTLGKNLETSNIPSSYQLVYEAEPVINIGTNVVKFLEDSIKVGCTTVPNKVVEEIYNRIRKE